jgi:hypothetical protein
VAALWQPLFSLSLSLDEGRRRKNEHTELEFFVATNASFPSAQTECHTTNYGLQ